MTKPATGLTGKLISMFAQSLWSLTNITDFNVTDTAELNQNVFHG